MAYFHDVEGVVFPRPEDQNQHEICKDQERHHNDLTKHTKPFETTVSSEHNLKF